MLLRILPLCAVLLALSAVTMAQHEVPLPRYLTEQEVAMMSGYRPAPGEGEGLSAPLPAPVRSMAEWEELQALLITWRSYPNILSEIVRAAQPECRVLIVCSGQAEVGQIRNTLLNRGIDPNYNIEFIIAPSNSVWIRDYGPNCVYLNGVDSLCLIDWRYNRPRPLDDALPSHIAQYLNLPLYSTTAVPDDLVHTGGNFMSDGLQTGFSSALVLHENSPGNPFGVSAKTEADVDRIMREYSGIIRYIKMDTLPYDRIHHIDMHMKLLDEETLLVGQYPEGIADGPQIEANLQYVLSHFKTYFGTPFRVIRIPMPPHGGKYPHQGGHYRTYTNAVFVNKTVIVPFYEEQYDTTARRIWETALPGYRIVGVNSNEMIGAFGAIHCITKEIGVPDPLHIVHQPLPYMDNARWPKGYPIWANFSHRSGIDTARVCYTTDPQSSWSCLPLQPYLPDDTIWNCVGSIPPQPTGTTVYYYLEGVAKSGKRTTRPLPAPKGYWKFCVEESVGTRSEPVTVALLPIYPNPASSISVVPLRADRPTYVAVRVYNAVGQMVQQLFEGEMPAGDQNLFLRADRLPAGAYWLAVHTSDHVLSQKFLVR